jgi:hypothetical protein
MTRRHASPCIAACAGTLLLGCLALAAFADLAGARPLYAMRTGMSCARCHVDPAGGGIRTASGFRYALDGHTMAPAEERSATVEPQISDGLRLGGDFRAQYIQQFAKETSGGLSTFHMMESALYVAAQLVERVSLVYGNDRGQTLEAFALITGLPMQGAVKVGRFRPAFGIEEEAHDLHARSPRIRHRRRRHGHRDVGGERPLCREPGRRERQSRRWRLR